MSPPSGHTHGSGRLTRSRSLSGGRSPRPVRNRNPGRWRPRFLPAISAMGQNQEFKLVTSAVVVIGQLEPPKRDADLALRRTRYPPHDTLVDCWGDDRVLERCKKALSYAKFAGSGLFLGLTVQHLRAAGTAGQSADAKHMAVKEKTRQKRVGRSKRRCLYDSSCRSWVS